MPPTRIVDPTGVGDAFRAGYMKGLSHARRATRVCARMGAVAATYALEHLGGQSHAFTWAEFRARYEANFGPTGVTCVNLTAGPDRRGADVADARLDVARRAVASGRLPVLTLAVYQAGSLVCHQRPERSFHLAGVQLPVCARCFGLYLSGAVGLVVASRVAAARYPARPARLLLAMAALPIASTVALEWLGLIHTTNVQRMLTGLPLGFAAGVVIVRSLARPRDAI